MCWRGGVRLAEQISDGDGEKNIKNVFPLLKMNSIAGRVTSVKHLASDVYLFLCIYITIRRRPTRLIIRICIKFSLE